VTIKRSEVEGNQLTELGGERKTDVFRWDRRSGSWSENRQKSFMGQECRLRSEKRGGFGA